MNDAAHPRRLNASSHTEFVALLAGTYEHSPWVAERAWPRGPFRTLAQLKRALVEVVAEAGRDDQLALLRSHPELAGKAMAAGDAHARIDATSKAGRPHRVHAGRAGDDRAPQRGLPRPLRLPVHARRARAARRRPRRRPRSSRPSSAVSSITPTSSSPRRCATSTASPSCVSTTASTRRRARPPGVGLRRAAGAPLRSRASPRAASSPSPTSPTRTARCAAQIASWMRECGFDRVDDRRGRQRRRRLRRRARGAKTLLTGSHYDTVRNGGKYDGRLGIFVPMIVVRELHRAGRRLPYAIEVVAFAEEEGQRYKATFLGSGALVGQFDARWLDAARRRRRDDEGGDAPRRPAGDARGDRGAEARRRAATSPSSRSTSSRARC